MATLLARLLVPLLIPRYPLPGVVAACLLDMVDYTVIRDHTNYTMENYQGFDKALDIYYLVIAYLSTLRNWTNLFAYRLGRFLIYWRLVGVVLFELTQLRGLLFIFTNAFEYFFMFYEAVRLRWDPLRVANRVMVGAVAFIWIFIKLPQEYIIHIGQFDTTVWVDAFFNALRTYLWLWVVLALLVVFVIFAVRWIFRRLPPADWAPSLVVELEPAASAGGSKVSPATTQPARFVDSALWEKIALVGLVSIIYVQILPEMNATVVQVAIFVAIFIVLNTLVSHWLARRGVGWASIVREFIVMAVINLGLVLGIAFLLPRMGGSIHLGNTLFMVLLITLIVTLYDRYRPVYEQRVAASGE